MAQILAQEFADGDEALGHGWFGNAQFVVGSSANPSPRTTVVPPFGGLIDLQFSPDRSNRIPPTAVPGLHAKHSSKRHCRLPKRCVA
jgi:hypothetical protein